jgi:hypothetical protein
MKPLILATALAVTQILSCAAPASSQARPSFAHQLPSKRAYHACLYEAWVQEYCRATAGRWGSYERVLPACILANRGGRFPLVGAYWDHTDDYCWSRTIGLLR